MSEVPPPAPTQPDEDSLEPWKDWIKRCTYYAEEKMRSLGIEDWVTIQRRRKWKWARRVATDTLDKWTLKTLTWDPTLDTRHETRRHPGRPYTRWSDDITNHITQQSTQHNTAPNNYDNTEPENRWRWIDIAQHQDTWNALEQSFVFRTPPAAAV